MWTPKDIPKKLNPTGEIGAFDRSGQELRKATRVSRLGLSP